MTDIIREIANHFEARRWIEGGTQAKVTFYGQEGGWPSILNHFYGSHIRFVLNDTVWGTYRVGQMRLIWVRHTSLPEKPPTIEWWAVDGLNNYKLSQICLAEMLHNLTIGIDRGQFNMRLLRDHVAQFGTDEVKQKFAELLAGSLTYWYISKTGDESKIHVDAPNACQLPKVNCISPKYCRVMNCTELIGLRKPGTAPGTWTGAFVKGLYKGRLFFGLFEDGMDFVPDAKDTTDAIFAQEYERVLKLGWQPMTLEDMRSTAGLDNAPTTEYCTC